MSTQTVRCYYVTKDEQGRAHGEIRELTVDDLPPGDVLIRVAYSSLNYKDALSATGNPGVTRKYPHIPGIDAAGTVAASTSPRFRENQEVVVTGFDLGASAWGGYAQYVRVPEGWIVPLPSALSLRESMIFGTAGFTAALSLEAILHHGIASDRGEVLVTGASGGVGSMAVAILAQAGFHVVAVTGKQSAHDLLKKLGAQEILPRGALNDTSGKPLLAGRWAAAVDTVGGNMLATVLRSTKNGGCVTACGLVAGPELPITVFPFILRGVVLAGIDSATYPIERRAALWSNLAGPWRPPSLEAIVAETVDLADLERPIKQILAGEVAGRVLVTPG